jgi:hypothetical protein
MHRAGVFHRRTYRRKRGQWHSRFSPVCDRRFSCHCIFGVDLTEIPGINALTAHVLFAEIGPDLSRFANASAFVVGPMPG